MNGSEKEYKDGHSLVWDENAKLRKQKWPELRERIENTQGGVGVASDDFLEMLRYRPAPFHGKTQALRDSFSHLTRDANDSEDLDRLAEILAYMLRDPWSANLDAAWFIYYLEEQVSRDIDLKRAAAVINRLHGRYPYAAQVLCKTLSSYIYGEDEELVIDLILKTNLLSAYVIDSLKTIHFKPPRVGERHLISYPHLFVSYSRADINKMQELCSQLQHEGFKTWTDELLEPGTPEWQETIEAAIQESGGLVVLMTPNAKTSTWVNLEIDRALDFGKRVFPALADGDDENAVPPQLANVQRVDIRKDSYSGLSTLGSAIRRHLSSQPSLSNETNT